MISRYTEKQESNRGKFHVSIEFGGYGGKRQVLSDKYKKYGYVK
jgi:hypothetical protein